MWELFSKGGLMMYPLFLSSILVVAIVLERFWSLRRRKIVIPEIVTVLDKFKTEEDLSLIRSICEKFEGPFANIIITCIDNKDLPAEELRVFVEDQGRQEVRSLNRGLGLLETNAQVAPLLGLLGTVLGMIKVFNVIQTLGVGQAKALSGGISEALITTATGLFIGIPALIFYFYLNNRVENLTLDIEKYTISLLNKLFRIRRTGAPVEQETSINFRSQ